MQYRTLLLLTVVLALPVGAADSVFVEGAFNGRWDATFLPLVPGLTGPINFVQIDETEGIAKMQELRGNAIVGELCPAAGERREFYSGDYDYNKRGEFYGCTNGETLVGVYRDFDRSDQGSIKIDMTTPGASPRWEGTFTNGAGDTGPMQGAYGGGGIATPLARVGDQPALISLSGASFTSDYGLAPDSFVTVFGQGLADDTIVDSSLPTALGGVTLVITDSAGSMHDARLYVVSPTQINYLIPPEVAAGAATIAVNRDGEEIATEQMLIAAVAPGLFSAASNGMGPAAAVFLRVNPDGSRSDGLIFDGALSPIPLDLGPSGTELYVFLFGTGMRNFSGNVTVTVDGLVVPFAGPVAQGEFEGLDQINLGPLPRSLAGRGVVEIVVTVDGKQANVVTVAFM